ncbi:MAG TPA: OmpA family protein [Saprospiraceae bacterium]|nr:OmpA family protein [Saprospiraceae bacterium]HMQ84233.1 OmpA family protein [Saprospiraceae bacterium]
MRKVHIRYLACFALCFCLTCPKGQSQLIASAENIVPNPGFEAYRSHPIGWFYNGKHFTEVMKYWHSPTSASPDVFGPQVQVPQPWAEKGFGNRVPYQGETMVGITVYGCEEGKPHCREYLQVQLIEPLVVGQQYYVEFWASPLDKSIEINELGASFLLEAASSLTDGPLPLTPQIFSNSRIGGHRKHWHKISGYFEATEAADFLIIGNFLPDSLTTTYSNYDNHYPFAYYYIDAVLVRKEPPLLPIPIDEDDLSLIELEKGKTIRLKNIFFETDKAELLPRSFLELKKLLQLMQKHPHLVIEIRGHTDIRGNADYNEDLSLRRARSVVDFLKENGVEMNRVSYIGFGSSQPIASNEDEQGRQLNRRVEFRIVSMEK